VSELKTQKIVRVFSLFWHWHENFDFNFARFFMNKVLIRDFFWVKCSRLDTNKQIAILTYVSQPVFYDVYNWFNFFFPKVTWNSSSGLILLSWGFLVVFWNWSRRALEHQKLQNKATSWDQVHRSANPCLKWTLFHSISSMFDLIWNMTCQVLFVPIQVTKVGTEKKRYWFEVASHIPHNYLID